jgi:hypothetical protein
MKFAYAVVFGFLVVAAAVSPRPAYATAGKIIIKAPDPTCPPPAGYQTIASNGLVGNADGGFVQGGSVVGDVDGSTPFGENEFANCTGITMDVLTITIDDIPPGEQYIVLLSGDAFDGFSTGPLSNSSETLTLYCDPSVFTTSCDGLSGVAGSDNGIQMIVNVPEPADGALLFLGIGGIALLGLSGRKGRKQLIAA